MEGGREVRERERVEGRRGWREGDFEKEGSGRGERSGGEWKREGMLRDSVY